ncbi:TetR/AcrR family transcriptional regulator [Actinacidiphila sp. ITFR-21]|uniref:TetR/AcrR family transcriptional regulator n=1 Tax=Actinacidiphila sp. ITFR-21 TaxID=3075199 RepID=UPI00288BAFF2|nr:TetR/AcrR family transcriptional regulator [Streptomyces sp. ITFR-21]WNI19463.1 TetR/AcrR family transcriptional regulator [Streptomyces sp. ITFR-21]
MTTVAEDAECAETRTRSGSRTRSDALPNRERTVVAAREAFVEHGSKAPLDEIARRAGTGNATLYRHFADRRALIHDVLPYVVVRTADHAQAAAAEEADPFTALCRFAHAAADERIGALCGILVGTADHHSLDVNPRRERLKSAVERLMDKARRAGRLRDDVTVRDLIVGLSQLTRPLPGLDRPDGDDLARRRLRPFLGGLRRPAPPPANGQATKPGKPRQDRGPRIVRDPDPTTAP